MKQAPYDAPDFTLLNQDGDSVSLADFTGKWLVLYFYPKDNTPGCTAEACSMRDARDELLELGAHVVGVSMDDAPSHKRFMADHRLNFALLSDPTRSAIEAYGAWGDKMLGRQGVLRKTFIINPSGQVVKVYGRVTPQGHGDQIITDLCELQRA